MLLWRHYCISSHNNNLETCDLVKRSEIVSEARIMRSSRMLRYWRSDVEGVTTRQRSTARHSWTSNCLVPNFIATVTCQRQFAARLCHRLNDWQVKLGTVHYAQHIHIQDLHYKDAELKHQNERHLNDDWIGTATECDKQWKTPTVQICSLDLQGKIHIGNSHTSLDAHVDFYTELLENTHNLQH